MTQLVVPPFEADPWPTLGPGVCEAIEDNLVFGPGDLRGERAVLDDEQRALVYRMYEVHPKGSAREGKRRFQRVALSLRKGLRKTELAAWIAAVELHPEAPVRCDGWRREGKVWAPVGRPVTDPYIPMLAYTEDQSEELGYGALYAILSHSACRWVNDFDIGLERIMRQDGMGKAVALANAPDQADGDRTTFQHKDETHRWVLPRHRETDRVTRANLLKRPIADPWELETTTMYAPGESSVAESTHDYARKIASGEAQNPRLFYFHRQASDVHDLATPDGLRAAVEEASGIATDWSDIDGIAAQWYEPDADKAFLRRVWLNQPVVSQEKAFDALAWARCKRPGYMVAAKAQITIGFDGSRTNDATALVATEVLTGYQWPLGIWERPLDVPKWEVDEDAVDAAVSLAFSRYTVVRMLGDPPYWQTNLASWARMYGEDIVLKFETLQQVRMSRAVQAYASAITHGDVSHPDNPQFNAHIGNAHRRYIGSRDEDDKPLWVIQKERPGSPHKIDTAMAGCLSWEARLWALANVKPPREHLPAFLA